MADPLRAEEITLRDGRKVVLRPARMEDAESTMRNVNRIGRERIYIMVEEVPDIESERRWLEEFDGVRNVLIVAVDRREVIGAADCHAGVFPKDRHIGGIGIAIQDGWREAGLGRRLMERILEWMRARGFAKAELAVFATNVRARRLYESLGFIEEGVRRRHVRIGDDYVDEILMGLWLGP
ncbi:MAG TPA: GNAT family N-acetyltransferase [Thermoplasmata archaeon]|nr:GNAT family N-acetyltransferase [Thermoplasmata archaeon]